MLFVNDPPNEVMHCFPIVRPRVKSPLSICVATSDLRGTYTHWYGGKTVACCGTDNCMACGVNVKKTWQGHVLGYRLEDDVIVMACFTLPVKTFLNAIRRSDTGLFGQQLRMVRMGGKETGPIACTLLTPDHDRKEIKISALEKVVMRLYADNANKREVYLAN